MRERAARLCVAGVAAVALIPFAPGLTGANVFYVRDLSLFFWGRYLWLRRTVWSGEWPFWDPSVGAGQSAAADALHQMFLVPVLLLRLVGSEVLGFNLWIALPFPFAAIGMWGFLRRRFTRPASALGALAFTLSGPIVSTGNFPNMSWAVAALPWVLWTVDRAAAAPTLLTALCVALTVALQSLAGEPVTLFATLLVAFTYGLFVEPFSDLSGGSKRTAWLAVALGSGLLLAAVQLLPLAEAARGAERWNNVGRDVWSLHPLMLIDAVSLHIFGDYFSTQSLSDVPWLPPLNSGREPFFFSMYFGIPLLALAVFGMMAGEPRRWRRYWMLAAGAGLIGAFGIYTPIYPFVRDHVPVLGSFRFPVKYLVVVSMAVSALAAAGWDALTASVAPERRARAARVACGFAVLLALAALLIVAGWLVVTTPFARGLYELARYLGATKPVDAAEFMLKALPGAGTTVLLLALATAGLVYLAASPSAGARQASLLLYAFVAGDLLIHAWGINPVFDPKYLAEPAWIGATRSDPNARFYVGGKREGTLDPGDADSSRAFVNPPGLRGSASRAALSAVAAYYPSPWQAREMLSYDLAVLWPRSFGSAVERFFDAGPAARQRFLERTGVRFRILPERRAEGHAAIVPVPYFYESFLYDWGADSVLPRASIVAGARVVPDTADQVDALFQPDWDGRAIVHVDRDVAAEGTVGAPVASSARIVRETPTAVTVSAGCGAEGGYLLLLDSYTSDWRVMVDGRPATLLRANGLFRAVHLAPGAHTVGFAYRPAAVRRGATVSAATALIGAIGLAARLARRRRSAH
jgi:hypothetical protein